MREQDDAWLDGVRTVDEQICRENNSETGRWLSAGLASLGMILLALGESGLAGGVVLLIALLNAGSVYEHRRRMRRAYADALRRRDAG